MDEKIRGYILDLTLASREPESYKLERLKPLIAYGASPRATLALAATARALAFLNRRGYVTPEDVKTIAPDVLRHRILLTYEAEAENLTAEDLVRQLLDHVEVP
jgi:MoxR-like ATPase